MSFFFCHICSTKTFQNQLNSPLDAVQAHHVPSTLHTTARPTEPYLTRSYSIQPVTINQPPHIIDLTRSMSMESDLKLSVSIRKTETSDQIWNHLGYLSGLKQERKIIHLLTVPSNGKTPLIGKDGETTTLFFFFRSGFFFTYGGLYIH